MNSVSVDNDTHLLLIYNEPPTTTTSKTNFKIWRVLVRCSCGWKHIYENNPKEGYWNTVNSFAKNTLTEDGPQQQRMQKIYSSYHTPEAILLDSIYNNSLELAKRLIK